MMKKLSDRGDLVLFIWGPVNTPQKIKALWRGKEFDWDTNIEHLRTVVSRWYTHVHKYGTDRAIPNG